MKKLWRSVFITLLLAGVIRAAEYRNFTNQDGQTIVARVVSYDAGGGRVQLELQNGKKAWVALSSLSGEDQYYIQGISTPYHAFGIRSKGTKVFFILDAGSEMMLSPVYSMKKQALLTQIGNLPPAHEFNVAVYSGNETRILFPKMVPLNEERYEKLKAWLEPLNDPSADASGVSGVESLGEGGQKRDGDVYVGPFDMRNEEGERPEEIGRWFRPAMLAMQMKADSVFLLTNEWGQKPVMIPGKLSAAWKDSSDARRWNEKVEKAKDMLRKENERRKAKGYPPNVIGRSEAELVEHYFPGNQGPPPDEQHEFSAEEYLEGFLAMRNAGTDTGATEKDISVNVILLLPETGSYKVVSDNFDNLTAACNGKLVTLKGESALKRYANQ